MIYEQRIYEAAPGKLPELHARFRDHTLRIFARHGLEAVGFWTYAHGGWSDQLVYLMKFEDMADRDRNWATFREDQEWQGVVAESHRDGPLTTRIRSDILAPTHYSPLPGGAPADGDAKIYELRIYEAAPGRLGALHARFRDHTLRIFANHGLDVVGFWTYAHGGWSDLLAYLMKFEDMADRDSKWATFREDEEWRQVRSDSERDGAIVTRIRSDILAPTDYSPLP